MNFKDAVVGWALTGQMGSFISVGKDTIASCRGCFLLFYNWKQNQRSSYCVNGHGGRGDGVKHMEGHKYNNVFAFTEACSYPNTFVLTFPDFNVLCKLEADQIEGVSALKFNSQTSLITLTGDPGHKLSIYNFLTGELLGYTVTDMHYPIECIKINDCVAESLVQLGIFTNEVRTWDLFTVCKTPLLTCHVVLHVGDPPSFTDACWIGDILYVVDIEGSIYRMNDKNYLIKILDSFLVNQGHRYYLAKTSNYVIRWGWEGEITAFKELNEGLEEAWSIKAQSQIWFLTTIATNVIVYSNEVEGFGWLNSEGEKLPISYSPPKYLHNLAMIYPLGEYVTVVGKHRILYVFKVNEGKEIAGFELRMKPLIVKENPDFPYVAIGYSDGILELVSLYIPDKPTIITSFHLSRNPIQSIYFCSYGKIIVTCFKNTGEFFILEGFPGSTIKVIACVQANVQVIDYMMVGSKPCYRLFFIPITNKKHLGGYKIVRYCILGKNNISRKEYFFEDKTVLYNKIVASFKPNRDRVFYMVPMGSKFIHEVETTRGSSNAVVISKINSGHQLCNFGLRITSSHAITYGYDGFVFVRDKDFQKEICMTNMHHRRYMGVENVYVDHYGTYIVSIGKENVLVCARIRTQILNAKKHNELMSLVETPAYKLIFTRPTKGFTPKGTFKDMCWVELEAYKTTKEEAVQCKEVRQKILKDLEKIKSTIRRLVTENIHGPDNQRLDLTEFNLDIKAYKEACKRNDEECEMKAAYCRQLIAEQDRVYNYIRNIYCDKMDVSERQMHAIYQTDIVANYALDFVDQLKKEEADATLEFAKMDMYYHELNKFSPWFPYAESHIDLLLNSAPKMSKEIEELNLELKDTGHVVSSDTKLYMDGTMSNLFIEKTVTNQTELTTFVQMYLQNMKMMRTARALKEEFNQKFDALMDTKQRRIQTLKERNDRQRKIISETNYFSDVKIYMDITDPQWNVYENPVMLLQVLDSELSITPYVSPSEQAILDAKAAEEERIRLLLLADDFKERALMAMMNGVLEIRWEDELKKDVPLPKCMVEKDPKDFIEEDLRAIKEYEDKVLFLQSERERYKGLLDKEFTKNCIFIRDTIKKFNLELIELNVLKMNIESAVLQEQTIINCRRLTQMKRVMLIQERAEVQREIKRTEVTIEDLFKTLHQFEEIVKEFKLKNENVAQKDKLIDKNFKREMNDFTPVVLDMANKILKKRPKASYKQITSTVILQELSKCVVTGERSVKLNEEAIEFLISMNVLDQPVGLPPQIDEHAYAIICKNRRLKVELELKMKIIHLEIANSDSLMSLYTKRLATKKEALAELNKRLDNIHQELLSHNNNAHTQFVMRNGLVHLDLRGEFSDFETAVLVPKDDILKVNELIVNAGNAKLKTMEKNMAFHRNVMENEWKHVRRRMVINDLNEQLSDIKEVKVTKEVQTYLKYKRTGATPKINTFEMEVEQQKNSFLNQLKELRGEMSLLKKQINGVIEKNEALDQEIHVTNIRINTFRTQLSPEMADRNTKLSTSRMKTIVKRSNLVREMQQNHSEILMLQTELELLRLKTYPTFQYKLLHKD